MQNWCHATGLFINWSVANPSCTWMDVRMEETSYVGLQRFWRMSKHILPSAYTNTHNRTSSVTNTANMAHYFITTLRSSPFGWNILEMKRTVGGLLGYSSENSITSLNVPAERERDDSDEHEWHPTRPSAFRPLRPDSAQRVSGQRYLVAKSYNEIYKNANNLNKLAYYN